MLFLIRRFIYFYIRIYDVYKLMVYAWEKAIKITRIYGSISNHSHRREYIKRYFNVQIGRMEQMKIVFYTHFYWWKFVC